MQSRSSTQSGSGRLAPQRLHLERAVDGEPAHDLGVDVVARRQPGLPDAVVGLVPATRDGLHHRLDDAPVLVLHRAARGRDGGDEVGDRAEDVELDLAVGGVADAHRPRAGVAGQRLDDGLGAELEPFDGVERVQPLRVAAGARDAPVDPVQERLGLGERAEVDEHARRHRGVAQPAVAVVPVADAAELLGQRRRRRGEDRPGRLVAEPAQRQRAADHLLPGDVGQPRPATQSREAAPPAPADPRSSRDGG